MSKISHQEKRFALLLLNRLAQSAAVTQAIKSIETGDWAGYLAIKPDPMSDSFPDDYLAASLLKKHPGLPLSIDREGAALSKWLEAELQCEEANRRIVAGDYPLSLAHRAREFIRSVLGPFANYMAQLPYVMRHGPGVSLTAQGKSKTRSAKTGELEVGILPALKQSFHAFWPGLGKPRLHGFSEMCFVPKTALIDRTIEIQATGTLYFQLGLGALIRDRLHEHCGIDLDTQADRNRVRVRLPGNCTIDLASASDTVSFEVVRLLLPDDWFTALSMARTPVVKLPDGSLFDLQKFSGMGCGFTFELETLVFLAIAFAVTGKVQDVFGDDIIAEQEWFEPLKTALVRFGFSVNGAKSFGPGDFHESCGVDVWRGLDVRPFYMYGVADSTFVYPDQLRQQQIEHFVRRCVDRVPGITVNTPFEAAYAAFEDIHGGRRKAGKLLSRQLIAVKSDARHVHDRLQVGTYWAGIANRLYKYATQSSGFSEVDKRFYRPFIHARRLAAEYGVKSPVPYGFGDGGVTAPYPPENPAVKPAKAYQRGFWVNNVASFRAADELTLGTAAEGALINALYDPDDLYRRGAGCPEQSVEGLDGQRKARFVAQLFAGTCQTSPNVYRDLARYGLVKTSTTTEWTRGFDTVRGKGLFRTSRTYVPEWHSVPWWTDEHLGA